MTFNGVLKRLKAMGNPRAIEGMARFGIMGKKVYGISVPALRKLARQIGKDHALAERLWGNGVLEARFLAGMIDDPKLVKERQAERWVRDFDSWAVCDGTCLNLFCKTPFAYKKCLEWSRREEELVKRAAFALIACLAVHDKAAPDTMFAGLLRLIKREALDERNFVKKAVNWALRQIGKRNRRLHRCALRTGREIRRLDSRSARWIAADALRELESPQVLRRLKV